MENSIIKSLTFTKSDSDSNEHYHSQDSISGSGLKKLKESPAHYKYGEFEETEAMRFGTAYHTFVLENEKFYDQYKVIDKSQRPEPEKTMGSKANSAWLADLKDSGLTITTEIHEQLKAMKKALFKHPYAKSLLTGGEFEASYYCEIDIGSEKPIKVRIRPDHIKHSKRIVVDLKTASDASVDGFQKDAAKYDYQIPAALYADLLELIMGEDLGYEFFFIAQEKSTPYAFNIFQASAQFRSVGRYEYEILLMMYAYCLENNYWPGYQIFCQNRFGVNQLDLPSWAVKELEYFTHKL